MIRNGIEERRELPPVAEMSHEIGGHGFHENEYDVSLSGARRIGYRPCDRGDMG